MKILVYGINFAPELTGIGKYTGEMAAWLAARGHQVRVVTAPPYYPDWKVGEGFGNGWTREDMDCRVALRAPRNDESGDMDCHVAGAPRNDDTGSLVVYRCPLWVPPQPGGLKRLVHLASFALSSLPVMLRQIFWRSDVVWVVEPALFCAPAAVALARLSGARAWLHVQDFEVDAAFDLGLLRGKFVRSVVAGAERWLMRRFDVVSTISKRMHQRLLDKGVAAEKAVMAVNWVDVGAFTGRGHGLPRFAHNDEIGDGLPRFARNDESGDPGCSGYRAELGIAPDAVVALYSGNMGAKQGLELLAEVAKAIAARAPLPQDCRHPQSAKNLVFVFCGNGAGRADLVARCQGLGNVRFMDLQPAERLPDLLAMADIHLLPQRADAADLVMPSKLTGMLASARPVVATAHAGTELAEVVQGCGLVVPPDDAQAFVNAVMALAADPALSERLGAAGYAYALAHLDKEAVLRKFEADLFALIPR